MNDNNGDVNSFKKFPRPMTPYEKEKIDNVMQIIDYTFTETDWLWEALQAPGSVVKQIGDRKLLEGNRSLAAHGTKVIDLSVSAMAIRVNMVTSDIHQLSQRSTNKRILASICDEAGLTRNITENMSQLKTGVPERVKANTVEAVVAAVALDGGHGAALKVMVRLKIIPGLSG